MKNGSGNWRYENNKLKFNRDNTINIGNIKWYVALGLFSDHASLNTSTLYKKRSDILINTNVHKRRYQPGAQIKVNRTESDIKQFQNSYDLQMKKQIDELYTTIENNINSEAKQIEITVNNQLVNANKSCKNENEERFDKIEKYIFKWIGVEQLQKKYDTTE
uniref:Uncharacterized protein n=1 Tax=Glossina palpalis gambiensis TaxID=67801 RepID=A0A1B0BZF2_9MUSC